MVVLHVVHFDRAECAQAHMECDARDINALFFDFFQKLRRKVKSRSRCGSRARVLCIDCIVSVFIFELMRDIRRQGRVPAQI